MNIEQFLMQLINSGDMFAALKTTVLPVVIAVVGHNVLNYMKSVKAGALKKLHDAFQAQQTTLKDSTLVEIEEARKKAEAVVIEAATTALTKVLEDFNAKAALAQAVTDAKHEALTVLVSELKVKLDGIDRTVPGYFAGMLAEHKPYPEVLTNTEDGTHNNEPTEANMHLSKPQAEHTATRVENFSRSVVQLPGTPNVDTLSGFLNLAGSGAPYLSVVGNTHGSISSLASSTGIIDFSKQQGVAISYTGGNNVGSAKFVGQVESVVPGTAESDKDTTGGDTAPVVGV